MGGLFDDIFDDADFEIRDEEVVDESLDEEADWDTGRGGGTTWDTGRKPDIWNADEPWTCDDDKCDADDCGGTCGQEDFKVDDFFS